MARSTISRRPCTLTKRLTSIERNRSRYAPCPQWSSSADGLLALYVMTDEFGNVDELGHAVSRNHVLAHDLIIVRLEADAKSEDLVLAVTESGELLLLYVEEMRAGLVFTHPRTGEEIPLGIEGRILGRVEESRRITAAGRRAGYAPEIPSWPD